MTNDVLISVIVPMYNVEMEIERCVNSIREQTYTNLEIIIVDDGSTDNSGKIADDLAAIDDRIIVIHKENGGVGSARNVGLKSANGKMIGFVDADDYINVKMYETLYCNLKEYDADISVCWGKGVTDENLIDYHKKYDINSQKIRLKNNYEVFYGYYNRCQGDNVANIYFNDDTLSLCNKLFYRQTLNGIVFPEDTFIGEDALVYFDILKNIKKAVYTNLEFYYYYKRSNSLTRTLDYSDERIKIMLDNKLKTCLRYQKLLHESAYYDLEKQCVNIELFNLVNDASIYANTNKKRKLFKQAVRKLAMMMQSVKGALSFKDIIRLSVFIFSPLLYKKIIEFLYKNNV